MIPAPPPSDIDIIEKTTVFNGYFHIDAYTYRQRTFDGGWSASLRREVFERGHAAAVLPYDPDRGAFVLLQQFRIGAHPAGMDPWQLEIVAGVIETGETPEDVARRETQEEAGRPLIDLWPIQRYLVSPGGTSETNWLYLGRISSEGAGGLFGLPEENEHIRAVVVTEAELRKRLDENTLTNAPILIAASWFFLNRERILARWKKS